MTCHSSHTNSWHWCSLHTKVVSHGMKYYIKYHDVKCHDKSKSRYVWCRDIQSRDIERYYKPLLRVVTWKRDIVCHDIQNRNTEFCHISKLSNSSREMSRHTKVVTCNAMTCNVLISNIMTKVVKVATWNIIN